MPLTFVSFICSIPTFYLILFIYDLELEDLRESTNKLIFFGCWFVFYIIVSIVDCLEKKLHTTPEEIEPEKNPKSDNTKESETLSKNYDKFLNKYNKYYKNINTYSSFYNQIRCNTENNMFMFSHNGRLDAYTEDFKKKIRIELPNEK